jgi:TRAP-type C4-dicarboxylate transport system permease large subunit
LPIATELGIDPLQYGIVLIISMGWGAFAPPIGVGMYVACVITGATVEEITRHLMPYLAILLLAIVLVAMVPQISTGLPALFGMAN